MFDYLFYLKGHYITVVSSAMMRTPVDYFIAQAAGFHYCKILSPFKVMEWIYFDSIKGREHQEI